MDTTFMRLSLRTQPVVWALSTVTNKEQHSPGFSQEGDKLILYSWYGCDLLFVNILSWARAKQHTTVNHISNAEWTVWTFLSVLFPHPILRLAERSFPIQCRLAAFFYFHQWSLLVDNGSTQIPPWVDRRFFCWCSQRQCLKSINRCNQDVRFDQPRNQN